MTIELNVAKVLAHSVMLFAKDNWHKDYPSIPWESRRCVLQITIHLIWQRQTERL